MDLLLQMGTDDMRHLLYVLPPYGEYCATDSVQKICSCDTLQTETALQRETSRIITNAVHQGGDSLVTPETDSQPTFIPTELLTPLPRLKRFRANPSFPARIE